jgi:hypothetical protein
VLETLGGAKALLLAVSVIEALILRVFETLGGAKALLLAVSVILLVLVLEALVLIEFVLLAEPFTDEV